MPKPPSREQELSIRERKQLLFESDAPATARADASSRRPFAEYLRTTPAEPLSPAAKGVLYGVGGLVVLLLVAAVMKMM